MFIVGVGPVHEVERLRVGDRGCNRICDFCQFITAIGVIGEPLAPFYGPLSRWSGLREPVFRPGKPDNDYGPCPGKE